MKQRALVRRTLGAVAAAAFAAGVVTVTAPVASAQTAEATVVKVTPNPSNDRRQELVVHSPSMDRDIPLQVLLPRNRAVPQPTLYLLNGAGGGEDAANWFKQSDAVDFFADKDVNVIVPMKGAFSYYTDWQQDDPVIGRNKWTTFLTKELPPLIDKQLNTNHVQALAGISMAGTSVLSLAESAPGLYRSVAGYSGCAETSSFLGQKYVEIVVGARGGTQVENMWGPVGGPGWVANDPVVNAEKLRGTEIYMSTGTGLPGRHEALDLSGLQPGNDSDTIANNTLTVLREGITTGNQVIVGGIIEAAVDNCTHNLAYRLKDLNIPAVFDFEPTGTHSWGYWQDQLHKSWPWIYNSLIKPV